MPHTPAVGPWRELIEHAVVIKKEPLMLGFPDTWPLGLPLVVEAMGGFRQPIGGPGLVGLSEDLQDRGCLVPARSKDGPTELVASTDSGERLALDDAPSLSVVLGESALGSLASSSLGSSAATGP